MTYLSDRAKAKKRKIKLSIFGVVFVLVIIFWPQVKSFSYPYFEPALFVYDYSKDAVLFLPNKVSVFLKSKNNYEKYIIELEENVERLENKNASYEGLLADYQAKEDIHKEGGIATLVAHPLFSDITKLYSSIVISKGYAHGVEEGMIVYARGMQPVGVVESVHNKTAEVSLFSASKNKVDGVVSENVILPLVGLGGGNFIASVPKNTEVVVGDSVYLSSHPEMKLGTVSEIKNDPQDVFVRIYIEGSYNPTKVNNFYLDK